MILRIAVGLALLAAAILRARDYVRTHPQDVPWTQIRLQDPVGRFTGRKLTALHREPALCKSLMSEAGASALPAPARRASAQCGYEHGMLLNGERLRFEPRGPVTSCPVAAALFVFERQVLQPAAMRHFGERVVRISHVGSYSCRRFYNRADGPFSEHATANAFDVMGFTLEDGRTVSVLRDWNSSGPKAAFLREVRTGACSLFATVLSPDYNRAHADHLHFDQADRGASGWRMCR